MYVYRMVPCLLWLLLKANLTAIYHLLGDWVDFNLHDVHSFVQPWECC